MFASLQANEYTVAAGSDQWLNNASAPYYDDDGNVLSTANEIRAAIQANATSYRRVDPRKCMDVYDTQFVSEYGNVLLVQDNLVMNTSVSLCTK